MAKKITATLLPDDEHILVQSFRLDPANLTLDSLANITITSPSDGSYLVYDNSSSKWIDDQTIVKTNTGISFTGDFNVAYGSKINFTSGSPVYNALNLNNNDIVGVNRIAFADPGAGEGLRWSNIEIAETDDALTGNSAGDLQVTYKQDDNSYARRFTVRDTGVDVVGNLTVSGNIVPTNNETQDIGSASKRFKDIFLKGSTIDLGGTLITKDNSGNIELKDSGGNAKDISTATLVGTGLDVNGNADISGNLTGVSAITASGEIEGGSLDINGNADISGDLTLSAGGDGALTFGAVSSIKVIDNSATALVIEEADNAYITFNTADSGGEKIEFGKPIVTGGDLIISKTGAVANDIKFLDGATEQARFSLQDDDTGNNLTLTTYSTNDLRLQATSGSVVIMNGGSSNYTFASGGATFNKSLNLTDGLQSSKFVELTNHGSPITRDASEMDGLKGKIVYFGGSATKTLTFPHYSGFSTPHDEWIIGNTGTGVITCNATSDTVFKIFQPGTGFPATGVSTFDIPVGAKAHIQGIGYKLIFVELTDGIITGKELNINGTASITGDFLEISSSTAPTADDACHPVISLYDSSDRSTATLGADTTLTDGRENAGAIRWYFNNTAGDKSFCAGIRGRVTDSVDGAERGTIEFTLPSGSAQDVVTDVTANHSNIESPVMSLHKYGLVMRSGNDLNLGAADDVLKWDTGTYKQELRGRSSESSGADSLIELPDASGTVALTTDIPSTTGFITATSTNTLTNKTLDSASFTGGITANPTTVVDDGSVSVNITLVLNKKFINTYTTGGRIFTLPASATSGNIITIVNATDQTITVNRSTNSVTTSIIDTGQGIQSVTGEFSIIKGGVAEVVYTASATAFVFGSGVLNA